MCLTKTEKKKGIEAILEISGAMVLSSKAVGKTEQENREHRPISRALMLGILKLERTLDVF